MSVLDLVQDLERRGIELALDGDALTMRVPRGSLGEEERELLRRHKAEVVAWLRGDAGPDEDGEPFPLTDIQEAYLIGRAPELELGRVGCHAYREFEAPSYDLERLEQAWNRLVQRHPMLRAVVTSNDRQRILPQVPFYRMAELDLRGVHDAQARLESLRAERSHHVFDPRAWPLFDIRVTRLDDRVRLHVGMDLIIADAVGMVLLFREWGQLYRQPDVPLPPPRGSFASHCRAQARRSAAASLDHWTRQLDSLPGGPDLPRRPLSGPPRFERLGLRLEAAAWAALKTEAQQRGLTPSIALATAYADILAAWSRRSRFTIVATSFAAPPDMAGVVGDFTSTVLLEVDTRPGGFAERAARLQRRLADALEHASVSGVRVMRELRRRRPDMPVIDAVFTSTLGHGGLAGEPPLAWLGPTVYAITQTPQVAIDHHVLEEKGDLVAAWDVVRARFPEGVIEAMFEAYERLLRRLARGEGWNDRLAAGLPEPARPSPVAPIEPATLFEAFLAQARAQGDRPAVLDAQGALSYGKLARLSAMGAGSLHEQGIGPGSLVAVDLAKGWRQIAALFAILRAGAAYLPLDPGLPLARRRQLLADTSAVEVDWPRLLDAWRDNDTASPPALPPVAPSSLAYVIFTSGSTGQPKGVMVEHAAAWNTVAEVNRRWRLDAADRVLALSALGFDLSVYDVFGPLAVGGAVVMPEETARRDPSAWTDLLVRHGVTVWNSVPALAAMLVEHGLPAEHRLRLFLLSGDWIPLELVPRLRAEAPAAELVSLGGATEAAIWSVAHPIGELDPAWPSIPYGTALANQTLHVVNERQEPCPDWVVGEIEIGGAGLARGYWGDPERTAERFRVEPTSGERRYRTGDLGRFRPGNVIEFLGREDSQVKIQGHRIELGEIEAHLAQHEAVRQALAAAFPVQDQPRHATLHAFVVTHGGGERAKALEVLARPGRRRLDGLPAVPLQGRSEPARFVARRSVRRFAPDAVARAAFDALLGRLAGAEGELVKHRYPSAGSLYAVQTYALVRPGGVASIEPGLYYLDPVAHALLRLTGTVPAARVDHVPTSRTLVEAGFVLLFVADLAPMRAAYGPAARDFCLLEAGYMGQLLMDGLEGASIGLCPIGGLEVADLAHLAGLSGEHELLHALAGGVPSPDARDDARPGLAEELRRHLAARLPDYMVPRRITLIERVPLTPNGKVDRSALRALAEEGRAPALPPAGGAHEVPGIVAEILGREAVAPHANLFDVGATSLHIVRLHRRLLERYGRAPAVVDLFRLPTITDIVRWLDEAGSDPSLLDSAEARARRRLEARTRRQR